MTLSAYSEPDTFYWLVCLILTTLEEEHIIYDFRGGVRALIENDRAEMQIQTYQALFARQLRRERENLKG